MIPICENYQDYRPPEYAYSTIEELLSNMPSQFLAGLESVVLTNSQAMGKGKTLRVAGRKYARKSCLGFYHQAWKGERAWIEILVDNIVGSKLSDDIPALIRHRALYRNLVFSETLFHELGHHLEHTIGSIGRGRESTAETWRRRLTRIYARKRYWYLIPLFAVVGLVERAFGKRYSNEVQS